MCGIAGIVYRSLSPEFVHSAVRSMITLQKHRGPDGQGFYDGNGASLGHARLAIIDLADTGYQPMADPSRRYWITFNGEIYNYLELAHHLEQLGYQFRGRSDTEVLLAAYLHWGDACVQRLRGMFAFAIWDQETRRFFAARDRLGIKPFHYWCDRHENLFFSSEIKALLPFIPERKFHRPLAAAYLAWNLLDHDQSQTMVSDIKRLPPGHILSWRAGQGVHLTSYWELHTPHDGFLESSKHKVQLLQEFRDRFEDVVRLHLRADVPVGTSLSGGLDSSSIVGIISKQLHVQRAWKEGWQQVFSACFDEAELDERLYIDEVVAATGVEPHYVFPSGEKLLTDLESWIWHQEEPVGGTGTYAQYCVARLTKEHGIKVLLDGQGADEQLAGYRKFILVFIKELIHRRKYFQAFCAASEFFLDREVLTTSRFVDGKRYLSGAPINAGILWTGRDQPVRPSSLALGSSLADRLHSDITRYSLPLLLRYQDRNTMAFGVEARVPFVDHELVEWLIKLPSEMRLFHGWTKYILREALKDVLPEKVRKRKTKLGFSTPEIKWLSGPLKPWLMEMLTKPQHLCMLVDSAGVNKLLQEYEMGHRSQTLYNTLFRLSIFEFWAREFLANTERFKAHI